VRCRVWNLNEVVHIAYRSDYSYLVVFDDGLQGVIDFSDYLERGPVFAALRDPEVFRRATIEAGTIAWPNGADVAPESLYERCRRAVAEVA